MVDDLQAPLAPISETHYCAICCQLAKHVWTATRAISGDSRHWRDLSPAERARRVEQVSFLLRLHHVSRESLA